jgi:thiamine-phosphate pyrophosphorylase
VKRNEFLKLYMIAGSQDVPQGHLLPLLEAALQAGITCFQYREKGRNSLADIQAKKNLGQACQDLCRSYNVPFIVNDDVQLALALNADGVHVGQDDFAIEEVLTLFPNKIVGLSCRTKAEVQQANQFSAISYYGIGPVFATTSKADAKAAIGLQMLTELTQLAEKPVVAIGGISSQNAAAVKMAGVDGIAVISAITQAVAIPAAIAQLINA